MVAVSLGEGDHNYNRVVHSSAGKLKGGREEGSGGRLRGGGEGVGWGSGGGRVGGGWGSGGRQVGVGWGSGRCRVGEVVARVLKPLCVKQDLPASDGSH